MAHAAYQQQKQQYKHMCRIKKIDNKWYFKNAFKKCDDTLYLQLHYHMMISVLFYNCSITSIRFECIRRDDAASILYIFSCDRGIKYKRFVFNRKYRLFGVYN